MKKNYINQIEMKEIIDYSSYLSVIESLLFTAGEPLKLKEIASIIDCGIETTKNYILELQEAYKALDRGIKLVTMNDEYQLVTKAENSSYLQKLLKTNTRQSLSQAALETLAIIAYKQPITRVAIDEIRGVKSDRAILTLLERQLIKESGRMEVAGRPILYSTTEKFLLYFGLENLEQMPVLEDFIQDNDIEKDETKE